MSLFGSLSIGASAINVNQLALSVVGNNIANAGTEGYVREELKVGTLSSTRFGTLNIGSGASAVSTQQQIDRYLRERVRQADSTFEAADARSALFDRVQTAFNELGDKDISTSLNNFFSSIQNLANRPDDLALRDVVIRQGALVSAQISQVRGRLDDISRDISTEVEQSAGLINGTLQTIRDLNRQIVAAEAGSASDAGTLRSQRDQELSGLAKLIPIQVYTQPDGSANVMVEGDFLLFNGSIQEVSAIDGQSAGVDTKVLAIKNSQWPIPVDGGRLGGIQDFRDGDLFDLTEKLDSIARTLIGEFNKIHSSGQGTANFSSIEGTYRVLSPGLPMTSPDAGFIFPPRNGSFDINVTDSASGLSRSYKIDVDLDGVGSDDSLSSVVTRINSVAFGGQPVASVTAQGRLRLDGPTGQTFSFGNDSSGFLAAVGVNTFFTGQDARDISINANLFANPKLLATSKTGAPGNNETALALAQMTQTKFASLGEINLDQAVTGIVQTLGTNGRLAESAKDSSQSTRDALTSEDLSITGVSIDEEAVKMIKYQRSFQASARYISTINDLLTEVLNILR
jgi:flagellar hook-associated protein 1 FlgK